MIQPFVTLKILYKRRLEEVITALSGYESELDNWNVFELFNNENEDNDWKIQFYLCLKMRGFFFAFPKSCR